MLLETLVCITVNDFQGCRVTVSKPRCCRWKPTAVSMFNQNKISFKPGKIELGVGTLNKWIFLIQLLKLNFVIVFL